MPSSPRPPRQPERVRSRLIDAAARLLRDGGAVSIGTVAEAAGVTKGAVQHHFGTRGELFAAMYAAYTAGFEAAMQDATPGEPAALRYARAAVQPADPATDTMHWRALLIACVLDKDVAARWHDWVAADRAADHEAAGDELLVRLAADGLWLSDLLGLYELAPGERESLMQRMEALVAPRRMQP